MSIYRMNGKTKVAEITSQNVDWTTKIQTMINDQVPSIALTQARTVSPRYSSRQNITTNSWTAPSNGIVYWIGNINTTQYGSNLHVSVAGVEVWRIVWNVDAQNYNWDASGSVLVRAGDRVTFTSGNSGRWSSRIFVPIN